MTIHARSGRPRTGGSAASTGSTSGSGANSDIARVLPASPRVPCFRGPGKSLRPRQGRAGAAKACHPWLLANNLHQHPLGPVAVKLAVEDLLPRAEVEFAL